MASYDDYAQQVETQKQRLAVAQAIQQRATQASQGWGGDRYAHSPWEAVANALSQYVGKKDQTTAQGALDTAQKTHASDVAAALSNYQQGNPGAPAQQLPNSGATLDSIPALAAQSPQALSQLQSTSLPSEECADGYCACDDAT